MVVIREGILILGPDGLRHMGCAACPAMGPQDVVPACASTQECIDLFGPETAVEAVERAASQLRHAANYWRGWYDPRPLTEEEENAIAQMSAFLRSAS